MKFPRRIIVHFLVSLFLLLLVVLSPAEGMNGLQALAVIILGAFLTQWYVIFGLISVKLGYDGSGEDMPMKYFSENMRIIVPLIVSGLLIAGVGIISGITLFDSLVILLYVIGPTLILFWDRGLLLAILWTWFPIEFDLVRDHIGTLHFLLLPAPALIGLFALLWAAIVQGVHIPWFDWKLSKDDLKAVNIGAIAATIAIVPLGFLANFLTWNPENLLNNDITPSPILTALLVFLIIFLVQGIMEETLFRDFIFKHWMFWIGGSKEPSKNGKLSIIFAGAVIASIPFWGEVLRALSSALPFLTDVANRVGDLDRPLGNYEGAPIPLFEGMPVWPFYLAVALVLSVIGLLIYNRYPLPVVAALIASSMIFGFAHFEDWRYVFFASLAGVAYGWTYYKTKNLVASAMVHMGVDAIWSLLLSYP